MKTSSAHAPKNVSTETAIGCLTTNLAMPGFGSIVAGKRIEGAIQAGLSIAGFILTVLLGGRFIVWFFTNYSRLYGDPYADPVEVFSEVWGQVRVPLIGIGLFVFTWLWALWTSWRVVRAARKPPVLPPSI